MLKDEVGRTYNKIDYDADGQHLLYYHEETDEGYNNIPYLVDVEKKSAINVYEMIGEESGNCFIGVRDEKYIYYSVKKDKYNSTEIQIGYDLYRYNKIEGSFIIIHTDELNLLKEYGIILSNSSF